MPLLPLYTERSIAFSPPLLFRVLELLPLIQNAMYAHGSSPPARVPHLHQQMPVQMQRQTRTQTQRKLVIPYDIWYGLSAMVIGDYIDEVFCAPKCVKRHNWDGLGALLHLARIPRQCAVEHLFKLWGNAFINPGTMQITGNYKHAVALMRELSILAQCTLENLVPSPLLSNPVHMHPSCPLVRLYKPLLLHIAHNRRGFVRYWGGEVELWKGGDGELGHCERALVELLAVYGGMNRGVRYALVGRWVEKWVGELVRTIRVAMLQYQVDMAWNMWSVCRSPGPVSTTRSHFILTSPTPHERSKLAFLASILVQSSSLGLDISPFSSFSLSDAREMRNLKELVGAIARFEGCLNSPREPHEERMAGCWGKHCTEARERLMVVLTKEEMRLFLPAQGQAQGVLP